MTQTHTANQDALCFTGCDAASMDPARGPYGLMADAAVAVVNGRIAWTGRRADLPADFRSFRKEDLGGRLLTPALIDCHTHLVFAGGRAREFELRLEGASYEDIARAGGGINATVRATRAAGDDELMASSLKRLDALTAEGVGVVEIKSGYGLTIEAERRMLRIAREIGRRRDVVVETTWLAAHAIPPEYEGRADAYIDEVAIPGLLAAHQEGLVDAVDAYCEAIAFSPAQVDRLFRAAASLGLRVKVHAEQFTDQKAALLAGRYNGLSADHLEHLDPADVGAFAASGAVAVLLPGAFYFLRETKPPPVDALRRSGVPIAIATDCNPGSSPISSLLTVMNMACTQFLLTPEEALAGVTRNAARALGLEHRFGRIAPGAEARFALWDVGHPAELSYWVGGTPLSRRIIIGGEA